MVDQGSGRVQQGYDVKHIWVPSKFDTSSGQADIGVFDNVSRSHLILKPMVSLVKEETEDEVLAAMEEPCSESSVETFDTSKSNEVVRERSMADNNSENKPPVGDCSAPIAISRSLASPQASEGDDAQADEGLGKSFGQSPECVPLESHPERRGSEDTGSILSDGKTDETDEYPSSIDDMGKEGHTGPTEGVLSSDTLSLISTGQFKLDFEPAFDAEREVEIKKSLQRKIKEAKETCG